MRGCPRSHPNVCDAARAWRAPQGFVAVRANATALVMHFYASSEALPSYTAVITR